MRKLLVGLAAVVAAYAFADFDGSYILPRDHAAIQYDTATGERSCRALQQQLREGKLRLEFDEQHGYLEAVLKALDVPVSSQVLVFSKTSFQAPRISPRMARALYFTDDRHVGLGAGRRRPGIRRRSIPGRASSSTRWTRNPARSRASTGATSACNATPRAARSGVPGLVVRSVFVERSGMPLFHAGGFVTDHRSPLSQRWGGWYVTGTHGAQRHMGNVFAEDRDHPDELDREQGANVTDLKGRIDTGTYLSPHSDIVALMVLEHQTRMTNLITRVSYEIAHGAVRPEGDQPGAEGAGGPDRRQRAAAGSTMRPRRCLKYMLFTDEALLDARDQRDVRFRGGVRGARPARPSGRSLRDLDLTGRMFRYPCSYLIYSEAFDALPADRARPHLPAALGGADRGRQTPAFARLTAADRKAIYQILLETKSDLPEYWRSFVIAQ